MKAFYYLRQVAKSLLISVGIVLLGMFGSAAAVTINLSGTFGGTSQYTNNIDVNADGLTAGIGSYVWQDATLGNLTLAGISESVVTDPTDECPYGAFTVNAAEEMGYSRSVATAPNGDQLYISASTDKFCRTDEVGGFVAQGTGRFTGGTGQFAGATGSTQSTFTLILIHAYDEVSGQSFGSATGTLTGTLDLPNLNPADCNGDGVVNGLDILGAGCDS